MNIVQRLSRALVAMAVGAASCLVLAEPAAAATPVCTTYRITSHLYVPTSSGGSRSCWLGRGHRGDGVRVLQLALRECYGDFLDWAGFPYEVKADGDFGPITESALKVVQHQEGLDDDGVYGVYTSYGIMFVGDGVPCWYWR